LPLVLFESQDKVSLALRKEVLRRSIIAKADVHTPGLAMPAALHPALDAHLSAVPLPGVE